jgi:hypothetical protein
MGHSTAGTHGSKPGRRWTVAAAAAGLLFAATTLAPADAYRPQASAAHVLNAKDEAHLHLTGTNGSLLREEGLATGEIPGTVKASFIIAANVTATFTIYTHGGSISGHGTGTLHSTGLYSSFGGALKLAGGTGRYKHAHGSGGLYGVINRKTDALTVQTVGRLVY